jgi:hypothetical protein
MDACCFCKRRLSLWQETMASKKKMLNFLKKMLISWIKDAELFKKDAHLFWKRRPSIG